VDSVFFFIPFAPLLGSEGKFEGIEALQWHVMALGMERSDDG